MSAKPNKILIVLHGAIGDVVRGLSLAWRIKEAWPDVQLCWAVEPRSQDLVKNHQAIDRVFVFNRPQGFKAYVRFVRELRAEHFDLVLDLQRHFKSGITSYLSGAPRRIGFNRKNAKEFNWLFNNLKIPAVENFSAKIGHYQLFGDLLGLPRHEPWKFGLAPTATEQQLLAKRCSEEAIRQGVSFDIQQCRVALLLGSTWPSRFWQEDSFVAVVNALFEEDGSQAVLVGDRSEAALAQRIAQNAVTGSVLDMTCKTDLRELGALFSLCRLAIGSDCGPMHIAAAVGLPVISLFGATSEKRSAPYGSEHLVINTKESCSPCYRRECPGRGMICMKNITSAMVLKAARQVLGVKR